MSEFGSKLLGSSLMSAIYSFLKYLSYTQTSSGNVENTQPLFGSPRRDPFCDPSRPLFGYRQILWKPLGEINLPTAVLSCGDKYFSTSLQSRGDN